MMDELWEHKVAAVSVLAATPIIYYSFKVWLWLRKMRPVWDVLDENFGGPKKHWLFGNLHQVYIVFCFYS